MFHENYLLVLPLDIGYMIPADDSVGLLSQFIEKMFLGNLYRTGGKKVPDHATIARFRSLHFAPCAERTLAEVCKSLY